MDILKKIEEFEKSKKKPALVQFIGDENDYTVFSGDEEAESMCGLGACAACNPDEVPRDACIHHGAGSAPEFENGGLYLAYFLEDTADGFTGIAVRNNNDDVVFPRDAADFEIVEDPDGVLKSL